MRPITTEQCLRPDDTVQDAYRLLMRGVAQGSEKEGGEDVEVENKRYLSISQYTNTTLYVCMTNIIE